MVNEGGGGRATIRLGSITSVANTLGVALGVLSLARLAQHAFEFGFGPTMQLAVEYYEAFASALASFVEPVITIALGKLQEIFGVDLHLYLHWKHVFVLMGIYLFRYAGNSFRAGIFNTGVFRLLWATVVAFTSSVAAGVIPIATGDLPGNFLIAIIPLIGVTVWDLGDIVWYAAWHRDRAAQVVGGQIETWAQYFSGQSFYVFRRALAGVIIIIAAFEIPFVSRLASPGLFAFGLLIFVSSLWFLWVGVEEAKNIRQAEEPWLTAYSRTQAVRLGSVMIFSFLGLLLFVLLNAGLRPLGL